MKKNYFFKFLLLSIPMAAFLLMASSGGRDDARTGSPGDGGTTCAACHTTAPTTESVSISTNIPAGGYDLNTAYTVTVTVSSSDPDHGFQLTAERTSDNAKVGSFTAGTGSRVTGQRITHANDGQNSWTFTWTSPATDQGDVKFYTAAVAANGNGGNGAGDKTVTDETSSFSVLGISEAKLLRFEMYPNPSSDVVKIQLPSGTSNAEVNMYDYVGRLVLNKKITTVDNTVNVQELSKGMYIIRITTDNKIGAQQFIKS
ncbi:MAG: T9SS type A sorting domain-containing protein [Flavobacteriaceae bacterium]